jgi:hypothetical protein
LTPVEYHDADEIKRGIVAFARGPNDSLIVTGQLGQIQRDLRPAVLVQIVESSTSIRRGRSFGGGDS